MNRFRSIVLTGASSGIGAALAEALAAPDVTFLLIARNADRLDGAAAAARSRGAEIETAVLDVTDHDALAQAIRTFDGRHPVDLVIANAGMSAGLGPDRAPEDPDVATRVMAVNLTAAMATANTLIPAFLARGSGHIALMSSLAALRPHADMPSYSASKAGLRAWGISLRGWLRPRGIDVTVICPGFVTSPMTARHHGPKPFEVALDRAAVRIVSGLAARQAEIVFPWQLALLIWLGNRLPARLSDYFERRFAAVIQPPD